MSPRDLTTRATDEAPRTLEVPDAMGGGEERSPSELRLVEHATAAAHEPWDEPHACEQRNGVGGRASAQLAKVAVHIDVQGVLGLMSSRVFWIGFFIVSVIHASVVTEVVVFGTVHRPIFKALVDGLFGESIFIAAFMPARGAMLRLGIESNRMLRFRFCRVLGVRIEYTRVWGRSREARKTARVYAGMA